jgi:predicted transcriptional regulator
MVPRSHGKATRTGRPPAGVRQGERVREYPQVSLRVPPEVKAQLQALSAVTATPQWRIVSAALECFFRERSKMEQQQVVTLVGESARGRTHKAKR